MNKKRDMVIRKPREIVNQSQHWLRSHEFEDEQPTAAILAEYICYRGKKWNI